ncbi:DUF5808 domain-containing protein [Paenibacillus typhae]|uniref:DUF5808 domain-containing protein n=1 Tax=Paenibacillus typhae TaxID=1174501 RepID=UPI001C8D8090|nr:DUF5808 domain-containing protein [Paenibacillus typhae]MBY0011796.1 hypothetical protein [Paenibacillus typhae]
MAQQPVILISSFYVMIVLMLSLQVYLGLRTVLLGIVLPEEAVQDPAVRAIRRNYAMLTSGFAAIVGAGACFLWLRHLPAWGLLIWTAAIMLSIIGSGFAMWISRMSAMRLKAARGWEIARQSKRAASLMAGRRHRPVLSPWWYSVNAAVMALCIFFAAMKWDTIPQVLILGNFIFNKSVWIVFVLNMVQALNITVFLCYNRLISRARTSLDPEDREGSLQKQLAHKRIHSILAWAASLLMIVFVGVAQAIGLYGWKGNLLFFSGMSLLAVLFVALIGVMLYLRIKGIDQLRDIPSMEERHWKWLGSIYVNPEDPALLVPNIHSFGWTVNMANPRSKIIVAATAAIPVIECILILPVIHK